MRQLHIHALGINTGGGLVLLRQLLSNKNSSFGHLNLDERVKSEFSNIDKTTFYKNGFKNELISQLRLKKMVNKNDHILFFSSRPPLIKFPCKVSVFHQNANLLRKIRILDFQNRVNFFWFKLFKKNTDQFIVQNQFMRKLLSQHGCINTSIIVNPFFDFKELQPVEVRVNKGFIYVSSFDPHKNHINLIKAWEYLKYIGVKENLTLISSGQKVGDLKKLVKQSPAADYIDVIENLSNSDVLVEYSKHKALVYPSIVESFGLPILEAKNIGLAIIASERDFVRDIVTPDESFDPNSYKSIARAVLRYLKVNEPRVLVQSSQSFVNSLLEKTKVSVQKAS